MPHSFDQPLDKGARRIKKSRWDGETTGRISERIARFTGTPTFLIYLTIFVVVWIGWNTYAPKDWQFDSAEIGFTALTLMLSLQASYAAPLILLAQNRQDDRDRVTAQRDRQVAAQNLADTEYLTREIASLRLAIGEVATRDFIRSELRDVMEDREFSNIETEIARRDARIAELEERIAKLEAEHETN
ncbi:putative membrane protein [Arcanobacterium pluranimalium]|uniref:DUF1003 domain-containing protein n=1 Tax=Arcanobacterium pluranimalium TaxID=108028 RepID=UPI00195F15F0|nr:DUF1003 domain-containing protein [Arcanobacterium pluranimalium]MBM7825081.1 putative membrane protein [Arcanobacterium pluranimalium]